MVLFIYSEKATKFCKTSTVDFSYVVKSTMEVLQNFVAFSEYINFTEIVLQNFKDFFFSMWRFGLFKIIFFNKMRVAILSLEMN